MSDPAPIWFEDLAVGRIERYGRYEVTREEVLAFATAYDPQGFHVDDEAAAAHPFFGRLAASGWHTAAMGMRMTVDHNDSIGLKTLGALGIEDLRFHRPVYPGDVLRVETEVLDARPSGSMPQAGVVRVRTTILNQDDQPALSHVAALLIPRRPQH